MIAPPNANGFLHDETGFQLVFGTGAADAGIDAAGDGYLLLATERALGDLPEAAARAGSVEHVPAGRVDELAGALLDKLGKDAAPAILSLGGGRVVDTAKALAGAGVAEQLVAIPTSLSAAEMTRFHRRAIGAGPAARSVRPGLVANDPALSASQPTADLAASTANSVAHALAATTSPRATPISASGARTAIERLVSGWDGSEPDRYSLALGAALAGWSVNLSGLGLHHLLSQTVVRERGLAHGYGNLALLGTTVAWLAEHESAALTWIETTLDLPLATFAERLRKTAGVSGLASLGVDTGDLDAVVDAALERPDLARLAPGFDRDDVLAYYERAM